MGDEGWSDFVAEWHPRMGRAILKKWGFPSAVVAAVGNQNDRHRETDDGALTDILITATALVPAVLHRQPIDAVTASAPPFKRLGLGTAECRRLLAESAKQIRELQATLAG
jgi:HD-like signal output (HDOD) protein